MNLTIFAAAWALTYFVGGAILYALDSMDVDTGFPSLLVILAGPLAAVAAMQLLN